MNERNSRSLAQVAWNFANDRFGLCPTTTCFGGCYIFRVFCSLGRLIPHPTHHLTWITDIHQQLTNYAVLAIRCARYSKFSALLRCGPRVRGSTSKWRVCPLFAVILNSWKCSWLTSSLLCYARLSHQRPSSCAQLWISQQIGGTRTTWSKAFVTKSVTKSWISMTKVTLQAHDTVRAAHAVLLTRDGHVLLFQILNPKNWYNNAFVNHWANSRIGGDCEKNLLGW